MGLDFQDRTALVLGASAEGGSGWTIAEHLAARGARVAIAARSLEGLTSLASRTGAVAIQCDATAEQDVAALVTAVSRQLGPIDILIQTAGFPIPGSIESMTGDDLHSMTAANYFSFAYLLKHAPPVMADGGSVLVLTSHAASRVAPGYALYGAAKAATEALVRYAAIEFAPRGIRVNGLAPGVIATPMAAAALANPVIRRVLARETPLTASVRPDQIALEALNLVRPGSAVTGQILLVDNGLSLRRPPYPDDMIVQ